MKKLLRALLCTGLLAALLSVPAFAADTQVPAKQGDFHVLTNGEYVTFTDAVPKIKNDRSCLPFVATFEQLGFAEKDMTWNGETSTVTATKGDTTIALTIGKNQITLTEKGETQVIDTDVAPYIEPALSRTYIPFGLVADALGYHVGWDAKQGTVIIDDVDAILAANDETYELMDKYLDYGRSFAEKNQKVTGGYTMNMFMDMTTPEAAGSMEFLVDGQYEMLMANSSAFQFDTDMVMDMSVISNGVDVTDTMASAEGAPQFPLNIDMEMRGDLADGKFYFQSAALSQMMEQPDLANAWYSLDIKAMFDQISSVLGMDYATLMQLSSGTLDMSFEEYLAVTLKAMPLTSASLTTSDYLEMMNIMLADSNFKKSGSTYVNALDMDGVEMTFTIYTSASKVTGYALEMDAANLDDSGMEMAINASMKGNEMVMEMGMGIPDMLTITMSMDGTYQATSAKPVTAPPANAVIIDLMQLMNQPVPLA